MDSDPLEGYEAGLPPLTKHGITTGTSVPANVIGKGEVHIMENLYRYAETPPLPASSTQAITELLDAVAEALTEVQAQYGKVEYGIRSQGHAAVFLSPEAFDAAPGKARTNRFTDAAGDYLLTVKGYADDTITIHSVVERLPTGGSITAPSTGTMVQFHADGRVPELVD